VAAWNVQQYDVYKKSGKLFGKEISTQNEFPVIFYHYHYLRFLDGDRIELGRRVLRERVLQLIYAPYLKELEAAKEKIQSIDSSFDSHGTARNGMTWKAPVLYIYRKAIGVYNIYPRAKFLNA